MSKSALLSSSIAKKYWMAATGLFLCLFLVGHLLGNLQLLISGEEGKIAFNKYAFFMTTNIFVKVLSYATYISIIFHVVDGFLLTIQNKKARPVPYAYNKPSANSTVPSRYMAVLGTLILVFIATHMQNFWWKMKYSSTPMPIHTEILFEPERKPDGKIADAEKKVYRTNFDQLIPVENAEIRNGNEIYLSMDEMRKNITQIYRDYKPAGDSPRIGYAYKDLHSVVLAFFGHNKTEEAGVGANPLALAAVVFYSLSMIVLGFHLWHGFSSAFQSLGINHKRYNAIIKSVGQGFAVIVPLLFAIIPIILYMNRI